VLLSIGVEGQLLSQDTANNKQTKHPTAEMINFIDLSTFEDILDGIDNKTL
jgi:hypothetical protein